jgi:hypothetical protein
MKTKTCKITMMISLMLISQITFGQYNEKLYAMAYIGKIPNSIEFVWQYRDSTETFTLLVDSINSKNNTTKIDATPFNSYVLFDQSIGKAYRIATNKDTSNRIYYAKYETFSFQNEYDLHKQKEDITLTVLSKEAIGEEPKETFIINSWYKMKGYALLKANGESIVKVDNAAKLDDLVKTANEQKSFSNKIDRLYDAENLIKNLRKAEFTTPILEDGEYILEIYSDFSYTEKDVKKFTIKRH